MDSDEVPSILDSEGSNAELAHRETKVSRLEKDWNRGEMWFRPQMY